jgi:hypothetical protein
MHRFPYVNDGTDAEPRLALFLNLDTLVELRPGSIWPGHVGLQRDLKLAGDGFEGVQLTTPCSTPSDTTLPHCGHGRVNVPEDANCLAATHADRGDLCLTLHVGWGIETDDEAFRLVEAVLNSSEKHRIPMFVETHRATITQDIWRTVQITKRFPEVRFNGDFSHYYCGQELVYGDWAQKLEFMQPIFDRIGFMHGRIANPGCMQVPVDSGLHKLPFESTTLSDYVQHFRELWTRAMCGFLSHAGPGDILIFAPELLTSTKSYARQFKSFNDAMVEETDRYEQALILTRLAKACFAQAKMNVRKKVGAQ